MQPFRSTPPLMFYTIDVMLSLLTISALEWSTLSKSLSSQKMVCTANYRETEPSGYARHASEARLPGLLSYPNQNGRLISLIRRAFTHGGPWCMLDRTCSHALYPAMVALSCCCRGESSRFCRSVEFYAHVAWFTLRYSAKLLRRFADHTCSATTIPSTLPSLSDHIQQRLVTTPRAVSSLTDVAIHWVSEPLTG